MRSRPRRPASSAASMASGGTVIGSPRSHDRITRSERPGSASTNAGAGTSPLACDSAGQRRPSSDSQPSTRSTPPPKGSASTSSVRRPRRAAVTARPPARTDAPAPPRPPRTATTRPGPGEPIESAAAGVAVGHADESDVGPSYGRELVNEPWLGRRQRRDMLGTEPLHDVPVNVRRTAGTPAVGT